MYRSKSSIIILLGIVLVVLAPSISAAHAIQVCNSSGLSCADTHSNIANGHPRAATGGGFPLGSTANNGSPLCNFKPGVFTLHNGIVCTP
jgi:hypothetical protein